MNAINVLIMNPSTSTILARINERRSWRVASLQMRWLPVHGGTRKHLKPVQFLLTLVCFALIVIGCATPSPNPSRAQANTGYVDFHADSSGALCWDVTRFDEATQGFQPAFSDMSPFPDSVLRLSFAPGHYRFRVNFFNRISRNPAEVEVDVQDGKVTPVLIKFTETGTVNVLTKDASRGGTVRGRYGQRTKIGSNETATYDLSATVAAPVVYQPKEQMPYAR